MKRIALGVAAIVSLSAFSNSASAATLTFSDLTSGSCRQTGSPVASQNFTFTDVSGGGLFLCNAGVIQNNTTPALIAANTKSVLSFSKSDMGLFSLQSFFAGSRTVDFNPAALDGSSAADGITVVGNVGTGVVTQTFNFNGVNFDQFTLNSSFTGLSSVQISAFGKAAAPEFLINNIVVDSVAAVPEPSTWALFLLGFFGVGGAMRSKTRKSSVSVTYA